MKKFLLIAAAGVLALSAQAQYQVNPSTAEVIKGGVKSVKYLILSEGGIADFEKAGAKVDYIGPDSSNGRNLWYWENTFSAGDESMPRVDFEEGGYTSVVVGTAGWSGAGFAVDATPGLDLTDFNDDTMFHIAYMTPTGNGPASIALILLDGTGSAPAKVALGDPFNDNGAIFPSLGAKINDEWQGVEISLGTLKKIYPTFDLQNKAAWSGNALSWLGGGVTGQTMAFDAVYFYNRSAAGITDVKADNDVNFVVTNNTVNAQGAEGVSLYNLNGQLVKSAEGTTVGISDLNKGIYVVKAGNKTQKVVVK